MEEAPESYKNVTDVVDTCQAAGISKKTMKLRWRKKKLILIN